MGCEIPPEGGAAGGDPDWPPAPGPRGQPQCFCPWESTRDRGMGAGGRKIPSSLCLLGTSSARGIQGQKLNHHRKIRTIQGLVYRLTRKPFPRVFSSKKSSKRQLALIWAYRTCELDYTAGWGTGVKAPGCGGEFTPRLEEGRKGRTRKCSCWFFQTVLSGDCQGWACSRTGSPPQQHSQHPTRGSISLQHCGRHPEGHSGKAQAAASVRGAPRASLPVPVRCSWDAALDLTSPPPC